MCLKWIIARKQLVIAWNILNKEETYREPKIKLTSKQIEQKKKYYQDKVTKLDLIEKVV